MVQLLLFAGLREKAGTGTIPWNEVPISVGELKQRLREHYFDGSSIDGIMIAVNEQYAHDETEIRDGDTVALIPPVSGG
ncbi:MAG TPA: MoaD/ThiS family protein [Bacillales bacterium]|nr:MoaD/ThiS family protein [Bacillales bacterium]